jgi:hypothetical protein
MLDDLWFVAEGTARSGPFTADELRARVNDGRFAGGRTWKPGWTDWQPIEAHFTRRDALPPLVNNESPADPSLGASKARPGRGWVLAIAIMTIAAAALSTLLFTEINYHRFGAAAAFVYGGVWIAAVMLVIAIAVATWRGAANAGAGWPWQAGKALASIAVIGALAFSITFVRMTLTIHDISEARRNFSEYELTYDPTTRTIRFNGPIGPGFADRLAAILRSNSGVRTLSIESSPGGLIDEALAAAAWIEREPGLAVVATTECNSACFALFMAATDRRADYTAEFGFHRTGIVSDLPAFIESGADESGEDFRSYVIGRGLPSAQYDDWTRSDELYPVSAIELQELRIVSHLLSEGVAVEAPQAKWLWIAAVSEESDNGFADLARALAGSGEPGLLQASGPVFTAARAEDIDSTRTAILAMFPTLLPRVLESADPEAAMAYLSASSGSIAYLVSMEQWDACASIVDGRGVPDNAVPNSIVRTELVALAAAVQSAAESAWVSRPLPSWAEQAGNQAIDATISDASRDGIDNTLYDTDPRVRCLLTHRLLSQIGRGEATRSIVAYRWILAN